MSRIRSVSSLHQVIATFAVVVLVAVSCGSSEAAENADSLKPSDIRGVLSDDVDLAGAELWVGSDSTTTQIMLSTIAAELLASAGADVHSEVGLSDPFLTRDELRSGEIDLAYTGMGQAWTVFLREPDMPDTTDDLYNELSTRDLEENDIAWLAPLDFSTGRGLAVADTADSKTEAISEVPDLLDKSAAPTMCVTSDFVTFPEDGLVDFQDTLDVKLPDDEVRVYDPEPIYADTASGSCVVGQVDRANGRVASYALRVLEDDVGLFMPDNPAAAVRAEVYDENPQLDLVFGVIADRLSETELRDLNSRVDVDGEKPDAVARAWLRDEGLIE